MIILHCINNTWLAQHTEEDRQKIVELFGTNTIPTAFTAQAPAAMVLAQIRQLNPGKTVELA